MRKNLPTDDKLTNKEYNVSPKCCCYNSVGEESLEYIFLNGEMASVIIL